MIDPAKSGAINFMSTRNHHGSSDQHHQRAAELHDGAAHAHLVAAEAHEKQDHKTGHERSRQALEHSQTAHLRTAADADKGNGLAHELAHDDVAILAHQLWEFRGRPHGSPEQDWFQATEQLQVLSSPAAK
jgi:hypothetical protein